MSYCLCCNSSLLRHVRQGEIYLYCPDCRQAMPESAGLVVTHPCTIPDAVLPSSLSLVSVS
ncbi:MAG: hypothetical protein AAF282_00915 [Cyanobacteria bacterium P01_A01_bin.15]